MTKTLGDYDSFTFYGSFMKSLESIPDEKERNDTAWAILVYGTKSGRIDGTPTTNAVMECVIP